jgi:hypothetical protein
MKQKAPQELVRAERHLSLLIAVGIILPTKRNLAVGKGYEPVIRDSDAMSVTSQVLQYVLWSTEWSFGVNDPVLPEQTAKERAKASGIGQLLQITEEAQLVPAEEAL